MSSEVPFTESIRKKRDGEVLTSDDISQFVRGLTTEEIPPEQVSALSMAIFLCSMTVDERQSLTREMAGSGTILCWDHLDGPVIDKHSTGGVGDKVSLMLAPIVAVCGAYVPMIAGRGLGHTGGTIDKLEAIPGYQVSLSFDEFRRVVDKTGCSIIGQTADLAPADRRLYAIRDVTSTVESIPLITASILSKKIAAGLRALVMDIKVGNGAFASSMQMATDLAVSLVSTARAAGLPVDAVLTDMNECLGRTAGNALEIEEAIAFLKDESPDRRLRDVTVALCAQMLQLAGISQEQRDAESRVQHALSSGAAAELFSQMVVAHGGPSDLVDQPGKHLPAAPVIKEVRAQEGGYLAAFDTRGLGNIVIGLGGGRQNLSDTIDTSVGLSDFLNIGDKVDRHGPVCLVHAATQEAADAAADACVAAIRISEEPVVPSPAVAAVMPGDTIEPAIPVE